VPKVSQEHLESRRAEILEGARRTFARHGYDGATVARLEAEIGLSRGAIFHYFGSKLDLFAELALADNLRYERLLTEEGVEAVIRAIAAADRDWLTVLVETEVRLWHDPEFERRMEESQQNLDDLLDGLARAQTAGRMRTDISLPDLAGFLLVVINGLAVRVAGDDAPNIDSFVRLVNDALLPR
jgi:TetR/AcrR family transcriptional regulator, transcriptional repressor of aconitase